MGARGAGQGHPEVEWAPVMTDCASLQEGDTFHPLVGMAWTLGRRAPADILFPYPEVSRQHARLEWRDGGYWLCDLGSRFGTYYDGKPVGEEQVRLADGREVVLGGVISLRFHDPAETRDGQRVGRLRGVWLDEKEPATWVDGHRLDPDLSPAQFGLLRLLCQKEGEYCTRDQLGAAAFPEQNPEGVSEDAIDGLVKRIRARFREVTSEEWLEALRGRGLRLRRPE